MKVNGYQQNQVTNTSLGKLIVLLYEGAIAFTLQGQEGLRNQNPLHAGMKLLRARNIVSELRNGLDFDQGGDLAQNLERLYIFLHDELLRASREGDPAILTPVIDILTTLKEGWKDASQKTDAENHVESKQVQNAGVASIQSRFLQREQINLSIKV